MGKQITIWEDEIEEMHMSWHTRSPRRFVCVSRSVLSRFTVKLITFSSLRPAGHHCANQRDEATKQNTFALDLSHVRERVP